MRVLGRLVPIVLIGLALASVPFVFDASPSRCAPDGSSLVVGLHPSLLSFRHEVESYLAAPAAFDHVEVRPTGYDGPADLLSDGCRDGYRWVAWLGPEGADLHYMTAVVYVTAPRVRRIDESRRSRGLRDRGGAESLEGVASSALVAIARSRAMAGIEYFAGAAPEAIRNYVQGEALFRQSSFRQASDHFGYVVEEEPASAYGWYRLAVAQAWDRGQLAAWGSIARAMELVDSLDPADRDLVDAVNEHYQMEYGFREAFERVATATAEANLQRGDAIFHLARMRAGSPLDAVPHLEEAVRLDPDLTPARLHLIDAAVLARDSARAREHYEEFSRRAAGSIPWLRAKYALDLVFGDEETRERAVAAIESARARLPFSVPYLAQEYLGAPDLLPLQERLLAPAALHPGGEVDPADREARGARRLLVYNYLYRGRLEDAADVLARLGPEDRVFRALIRYSVGSWGLSWPDPGGAFGEEEYDPEDPVDVFYAAAARIEQRRLDDYRTMAEDIDRLADADPDVRLWRRALEARRRWLAGEDEAIEELRAVVTHPDVLAYFATHETMRWWLAEMAWRAAEWGEAAKWFGSLPDNPWARCRSTLARRRSQGEETPAPEEVCATADVAFVGPRIEGRPTSTNGAQ